MSILLDLPDPRETALITGEKAYLWTDGRYFIQAAKQLEDTTVELMKMESRESRRSVNSCREELPEGCVSGI